MTSRHNPATRLFYSYSHRDAKHQEDMKDALSLLRQEGLLVDWSDRAILPGQHISAHIRKKLEEADIVCFLLSQYFIASDKCMEEWDHVKALSERGSNVVRVPIIIADCAWQDLLRNDDLKALPTDGMTVVSYDDPSTAWQQVYDGLKPVIEKRRRTLESTDLVSQHHISEAVRPPVTKPSGFQADVIRNHALRHYVEPWRNSDQEQLSIRAGDVHKELHLRSAAPNVCNALGGRKFLALANVKLISHTEPCPSTTTVFYYERS